MGTWKQTRQGFARALRRLHLLELAEIARFALVYLRSWPRNRRFLREHADFVPPPAFEAFDAHNNLDWETYCISGEIHARLLNALILKHLPGAPARILEWGCGLGRITRHMSSLWGDATQVFGTDSNARSIAWDRAHVPGIRFRTNELRPPLDFPENYFDCVYGISVFTHLSEELHRAWAREIHRLLVPGGLFLASTHGDIYSRTDLSRDERAIYDAGELVVRGGVREGKKWFSAFHSSRYVRERLLEDLEVLEHVAGPAHPTLPQDLWVARKPPQGREDPS